MSEERSSGVSTTELAKLAGVQPQTVSNWRRRHADFPAPVSFTRADRPLFSQAAFEAWLLSTGRVSAGSNSLRGYLNQRISDGSPVSRALLDSVYRAVEDARAGSYPTEESVVVDCCALVALSFASRPTDSRRLVPESIDERIAAAVGVRGTENLFESIAGANELTEALALVDEMNLDNLPGLFEQMLVRAGWAAQSRSSKLVTDLISSLVSLDESPRLIFDPACGYGGFLVSASKASPTGDGWHPELVGQEIRQDVARIARQRALVNGLEMNVIVGDSLVDDGRVGLKADIVVCHPPWGTKREETVASPSELAPYSPFRGDFLWIGHCLQNLRPGAYGYVLLPAATLWRKGRDAEARRELLRRGAVEAVVELPRGSVEGSSISSVLWVLRSAPYDLFTANGKVLLISVPAIHETDPSASDTVLVTEAIEGWRRDSKLPSRSKGWAEARPALELIAGDALLQPRYWSSTPVSSTDAVTLKQTLDDAQSATERSLRWLSARTVPELNLTSESSAPAHSNPWQKVWRWIEKGALVEIHPVGNTSRAMGIDGDIGAWSSLCFRGELPPVEPSRTLPSAGTRIRPGSTTEPGDLIIGRGNRGQIVVAEDLDGGNVVLRPVRAIRVATGWFPPIVVRTALCGPRNQAINRETSGSNAVMNIDLEAMELPNISVQDAERLAAPITAMLETEREAIRLAHSSGDLVDVLVELAGALADDDTEDHALPDKGGEQ